MCIFCYSTERLPKRLSSDEDGFISPEEVAELMKKGWKKEEEGANDNPWRIFYGLLTFYCMYIIVIALMQSSKYSIIAGIF